MITTQEVLQRLQDKENLQQNQNAGQKKCYSVKKNFWWWLPEILKTERTQ